MLALTAWSPLPLTLYDLAPFDALFPGDDWGIWEKDRQNDLTDFTSHILMQMAPQFVNHAWVTQPALLHNFEGTGLQDEKGHRLQPVTLSLFDTALDRCTLTELIQHWHDSSGLCRSFSEASAVICFAIDRVVPPHNHKCMQLVDIQNGYLQIPHFNIDSQICWKRYRIAALAFHVGMTASRGHWRAALFHSNRWFIYDDGKLPEQMSELPNEIQRQVHLIWMIDADLVRTPLATAASAVAAS